jgi:hypothetical protein
VMVENESSGSGSTASHSFLFFFLNFWLYTILKFWLHAIVNTTKTLAVFCSVVHDFLSDLYVERLTGVTAKLSFA